MLQECALLKTWVEGAFAAELRAECQTIADGSAGKRNPKRFLFVPAGDVHDTTADPPPSTELIAHVAVAYLQGDQDTCLRHSMASVLAAMGFGSEAKVVAAYASLVGCKIELVRKATGLVQRVFGKSNLIMKKVFNHACSVADIAGEDASWPLVLIIQTSDGCHGTHAVATWNRMLFDSNATYALRWSQKSLDWCSGKDSACTGFSRAYRICSADFGATLPQSAISVGRHVHSNGSLGWIMRLPSKKKKGYHVRHPDGVTEAMSMEDVARSLVPSSTVGDVSE